MLPFRVIGVGFANQPGLEMAKNISLRQTVFCICAALAVAISVGYFSDAYAADSSASPVIVKLEQFLILPNPDGGELLSEAAAVSPGDLVEYRITYTNLGKKPIRADAQLPVPEGLEYQPGSARAAGAARDTVHQVAGKDSRFGLEPIKEQYIDARGQAAWRVVPYEQYRQVRWRGAALPPGASRVFQLRARVAGGSASIRPRNVSSAAVVEIQAEVERVQ